MYVGGCEQPVRVRWNPISDSNGTHIQIQISKHILLGFEWFLNSLNGNFLVDKNEKKKKDARAKAVQIEITGDSHVINK